MKITDKELIEINYWKNSDIEGPGKQTLVNLINKIGDLTVFLECIKDLKDFTVDEGNVLELGAGQGWASCAYKHLYPKVNITATDISEYAISSVSYWERVFSVSNIKSYNCKSYETLELESSLDLIFCFAAAHHFVAHKRTLIEIKRILKKGGKALYIYEPTTPSLFYPIAHWRVNRIRPEVPEDIIIPKKLINFAKSIGLRVSVHYAPLRIKRRGFSVLYYKLLSIFRILNNFLPCSAHIVIEKKDK